MLADIMRRIALARMMQQGGMGRATAPNPASGVPMQQPMINPAANPMPQVNQVANPGPPPQPTNGAMGMMGNPMAPSAGLLQAILQRKRQQLAQGNMDQSTNALPSAGDGESD